MLISAVLCFAAQILAVKLVSWGFKFSEVINKSSKLLEICVLETQTAQRRGKLAAIFPLMLFPHPLQNRVPRVRILLPLPIKVRMIAK